MAITLQTVLPQKVLPHKPSPNASSPNPGIRSAITQFIPASPDNSLNDGPFPSASNQNLQLNINGDAGPSRHARINSTSSQGSVQSALALKSPGGSTFMTRQPSMSAGVGSRRGIAHSSKVLGVDKDTQEAISLKQLTNGKVDVSFEGTLSTATGSAGKGKGKGKAIDGAENEAIALFDVDLESGQPTTAAASGSRAGKLLQLGKQSMPWKKSKSNLTVMDAPIASTSTSAATHGIPAEDDAREYSLDFARPPRKPFGDDKDDYDRGEEDGFNAYNVDDDQEQLLYAGATDEARPGYFAPGDRSFGYNSLQGSAGLGGYGGAVGFESLTWREGGWMTFSSLLVSVLVTVAILISIDVIDWPGDGLGNN